MNWSSARAGGRARWTGAVFAAVFLLVAAAACSSSGSTKSSSTQPKANLAALGTPKAATGTPIKIGLMTDAGGAGALDAQSGLAEKGAKIGVSYLNDYTGGIAGHKVELFVCGNKATPAGAQDCANQFVEQKVVAVVWPFTGQGAGVPIITGAGIPIVAVSGSSQEELTTSGEFIITGGYPGTLGAFALDAKQQGIKKFAMIVTDVPAATQAAQTLGSIVFKNAGVKFTVIPAAPGTADLTPQLQQAVSDGADALGVTGDVTFCTSFLQAYQTLGLKATKYVIGTCNDQSVVKALPNALEGAREPSLNGQGPDDQLYAAMVTKYGGGNVDTDPLVSSGVSSGVSSVMDLAAGMTTFTGEVTPAAITAQFKKVTGKIFLSGGLDFKCDGTAIPLLKNICSSAFQMTVLNADGTIKSAEKIDASSMYKAG
ncbi:MAG TPA: ABC transporter substrate-binding protein [Acidimicrobiales bacterium]|jgi:branched-chain amino acid transport system substrate-binding protein|nr:ABC transporter substrate-binding protein [Acidimicrobiales bacterium]